MGIYLNPGNRNFSDMARARIFVDNFDSLSHYSGNLLFVGVSYDEKKKTHTCSIEKMEK